MRKLCTILIAVTPSFAQPLTQGERDRAMSELHASRKKFLDAITGLSESQWNFKPASDVWSVAECAEHIAISEDSIFQLITEKIMKSPAEPDKRAEVQGKEEMVVKAIVERTQKFKAPEFLVPTRRWPTEAVLVDHFKQSRDRAIGYVQTTQDDLRSHFFAHPVAKLLDAYQWILLMSAHTERHTAQLNDVKANPNFPRN